MLPLQHLTAARDEPHALRRCCIRVHNALHERQCAPARLPRVLAQLFGGSILAVTVQRRKMHDTAEGHLRGQTFE